MSEDRWLELYNKMGKHVDELEARMADMQRQINTLVCGKDIPNVGLSLPSVPECHHLWHSFSNDAMRCDKCGLILQNATKPSASGYGGKSVDVYPPEASTIESCGCCGSPMVYIRGRNPGDDNRKVCPTCCQERLDEINKMSDRDYGKSYSALTGGKI